MTESVPPRTLLHPYHRTPNTRRENIFVTITFHRSNTQERLNGEKREWIIIKLLCIGRKINSKNICSTNRLILLICSMWSSVNFSFFDNFLFSLVSSRVDSVFCSIGRRFDERLTQLRQGLKDNCNLSFKFPSDNWIFHHRVPLSLSIPPLSSSTLLPL